MRKVLSTAMIVLMLTPVLVCVMASCPVQAAYAADEKPCHQLDDEGQGLMLSLDCMGVDLFERDTRNRVGRILSAYDVDNIMASTLPAVPGLLWHARGIRAPPGRTIFRQAGPSLILITQRLRI